MCSFNNINCLRISELTQTTDSRSGSDSSGGRHGVSTTSNSLTAGRAVPDTSSYTTDVLLTTERILVSSVGKLLNFSSLTTERGTVTDTVTTRDSNLLCTTSHLEYVWLGNYTEVIIRNSN